MNNITHLIRSDLLNFNAYSSARCEAKAGRIWLNANELPWKNGEERNLLNRYPEQQPPIFINALAKLYSVEQNQILATRGSDEGIDLLTRLFCQAGKDAVLICPPTFGMYEVCAVLQGASVIRVPLNQETWGIDFDGILKKRNPSPKLIFLCSPNNPTGNLIETARVLKLCEALKSESIIVVDEAYIEFSESESLSQYINQFENLVVLRTLSKAYGLAGARIGALLANPEIITWLKKILPPYPLPELSVQAAMEILQPVSLKKTRVQISLLIQERERLTEILKKMKIVEKVWQSKANFILVKFSLPIYHDCIAHGIVLRNMEEKIGLKNTVRITVGQPSENNELINVLEKL